MLHRRGHWLAAAVSIAAAVLLASCSSLPKGNGAVNTIRNEAAGYAAQGNSAYQSGDYVRAERYFKLALDADFSVDYRIGVASSYNSLGRVYLAAGDENAAKSAFESAELYARQAGGPQSDSLVLSARTGAAEILLVQGDFPGALAALKKAEDLPAPPESPERAALYHDVGAAYEGLGSYSEALTSLERSLEIHRKLGLAAMEGSDLYMIASVYSKQGDYAKALDYMQQALARDKLVENRVGIGSDLRALGIISEKKASYRDAYDYYHASLQVYRTLGMAAEVKDLLARLERVSTTLGRTHDAASYARALRELEGAK